jgi:2-oxoglutarate dehydrogenase E1 component
MGAWAYVQPRLATALRELCRGREHTDVRFVGRATSATTATGSFQVHQMEMKAITNATFELEDTELQDTRSERHTSLGVV